MCLALWYLKVQQDILIKFLGMKKNTRLCSILSNKTQCTNWLILECAIPVINLHITELQSCMNKSEWIPQPKRLVLNSGFLGGNIHLVCVLHHQSIIDWSIHLIVSGLALMRAVCSATHQNSKTSFFHLFYTKPGTIKAQKSHKFYFFLLLIHIIVQNDHLTIFGI